MNSLERAMQNANMETVPRDGAWWVDCIDGVGDEAGPFETRLQAIAWAEEELKRHGLYGEQASV